MWGKNHRKPEGTLRSRNVMSVFMDKHGVLNRREKELMRGGNAAKAHGILVDTYARLSVYVPRAEGTGSRSMGDVDAKHRLLEAILGMGPVVETTTVKRGGASYQVPTPVSQGRREARAVRWLVDGARQRQEKDRLHGVAEALALETLCVLTDRSSLSHSGQRGESKAITSYGVAKMIALHKTAKTNRVFAHRRWH